VRDPFAHLKEGAWRDVATIDARLDRGEIDEQQWHREMAALVVPAYLGAEMPWEQSGKSGNAETWEYARSLIADAIDRDGSFLDVGCANGYLMECLPRWTSFVVAPYGLEISPELTALARRRLPQWADRIWNGNAVSWTPPRSFTYIRTGLEYVPASRRADLIGHLMTFCERLIVGVFNEHESEQTTESLISSLGYAVSGRSERVHLQKEGMRYRLLWLDA
jgi:SAM-dependent methyltransferase